MLVVMLSEESLDPVSACFYSGELVETVLRETETSLSPFSQQPFLCSGHSGLPKSTSGFSWCPTHFTYWGAPWTLHLGGIVDRPIASVCPLAFFMTYHEGPSFSVCDLPTVCL